MENRIHSIAVKYWLTKITRVRYSHCRWQEEGFFDILKWLSDEAGRRAALPADLGASAR
jgi:hypothetical protein